MEKKGWGVKKTGPPKLVFLFRVEVVVELLPARMLFFRRPLLTRHVVRGAMLMVVDLYSIRVT